jgi:CRISPR-associated endonuclease Csn1
MNKTILGLDLGTNSIGWALVNEDDKANEKSSIIKLGVRVIHYGENMVKTDSGAASMKPEEDFLRRDIL